MSRRFITLMSFERPFQAEEQRETLENAAIPCVVVRDVPDRVGPSRPGGNVMLQVPEEDAGRAAEILEDTGAPPAAPSAAGGAV